MHFASTSHAVPQGSICAGGQGHMPSEQQIQEVKCSEWEKYGQARLTVQMPPALARSLTPGTWPTRCLQGTFFHLKRCLGRTISTQEEWAEKLKNQATRDREVRGASCTCFWLELTLSITIHVTLHRYMRNLRFVLSPAQDKECLFHTQFWSSNLSLLTKLLTRALWSTFQTPNTSPRPGNAIQCSSLLPKAYWAVTTGLLWL